MHAMTFFKLKIKVLWLCVYLGGPVLAQKVGVPRFREKKERKEGTRELA